MFDNHEDLHSRFPHPHLKLNKELKEFYAFSGIHGFAIALITIFEPIYIYLLFGEKLWMVFLFLGIRYTSFGLFAPLGARLPSKIGVKHTILLSQPLLFIYFLGLWQGEVLGLFFFLLAPFAGLRSAIYWPAHHMFFTRFSDKGKRGKELSYRTMILSVSAGIAPFVGGIIITFFGGFTVLFVVVLTLLLAATVPLFLSHEIKEDYHDHYTEWIKEIFSPRYYRKTVAFMANGFETAVHSFVWPLFLFIIAINYEELGIITSATFIFGVIFTYYAGRKSDSAGSEKLLTYGAFINAAVWPIKMFVQAPLDAFLANTVHRFGRTVAYVPFISLFYDWAGEHKTTRDRLIVFRETIINLSRGLALFSIAAVVYFYSSDLRIWFMFSAISTLGLLFMTKHPFKAIRQPD
ncbi:MAG: hypothetical protein R3346_02175 [Candidatus Spechtbacterales bacterium]|nr:hypothetical protein [Candidatus Spechtbacterales bacterium]